MASRVRKSVNFPDMQFEDPRLNRLMQFVRSQANEIQRLQSMIAGGTDEQVLTKQSTGDYDATWADAAKGNITGAKNLGAGKGLYKDTEAGLLSFRSLIAGSNVTIVLTGDALTIASSGGGGGTGTVTAVGIDSNDLEVDGSPVTTSGSITLTIKQKAVTYEKIQDTTQDAIVLGRSQFAGPGPVGEMSLSDVLNLLGGAQWGDILFRSTDGWEYLPPGPEGYTLTSHDIGADLTWEAGGGAGVVLNDPLCLGTDNWASAGTASWADMSICLLLPAKRLTNLARSFKLAWNQLTGSLLTTAVVLRRAARGTTTFLDSTPITFGGLAAPTFAPGVNVSDEIAVAIDDDHDYYVLVHFDATADPTAKVQDSTDAESGFTCASLTGDHTTDADPSAFTLADTIYGWIAAWVVKGSTSTPTLPLTTKGDLLTYDGSNLVRLGVGTDGYVLTADSTAATGLKWAAGGGGGSGSTTTYFGTGAPVTTHNRGDIYFDTSTVPYTLYVQDLANTFVHNPILDPAFTPAGAAWSTVSTYTNASFPAIPATSQRLVIVISTELPTSGSNPTVSSVGLSLGGLTFTRYLTIDNGTTLLNGTNKRLEVWTAPLSGAVATSTLTVVMSATIDDATIHWFTVKDADPTNNFWDDAGSGFPQSVAYGASGVPPFAAVTADEADLVVFVQGNGANNNGTGPPTPPTFLNVSAVTNSGAVKWDFSRVDQYKVPVGGISAIVINPTLASASPGVAALFAFRRTFTSAPVWRQAGSSSPLTTKGDIYVRGPSADARLAKGTDGLFLMSDSTATNGLSWQAAGGGGAASLNLGDPVIGGADPAASGSTGWANYTIGLYIPTRSILNFANTWQVAWTQPASGGTHTIDGAVIRRTARSSNVFIDSTPVKLNGATAFSLAPGITVFDTINVPLDEQHDYYLFIHTDPASSGTASVAGNTGSTGIQTAYSAGNHLADANAASFGFTTANIYGFYRVNVVTGTAGPGQTAVPDGLNLAIPGVMSGTNASWNNFTLTTHFFGYQILRTAKRWRVDFNIAVGSADIGRAVVRRTLRGSTTVIDTTVVTWGGSATPTLPVGQNFSDAISLPIDPAHDYWFQVFLPTSTNNNTVTLVPGNSVGSGNTFLEGIGGTRVSGGDFTSSALPSPSTALMATGVALTFGDYVDAAAQQSKNLTPDERPGFPTVWDDEFDTGSVLDTAGSRFSGANPWVIRAQGANGLALANGSAVTSSAGATAYVVASQPVPSGNWRFQMKVAANASAQCVAGFMIYNTANDHFLQLGLWTGSGSSAAYACFAQTGPLPATTFSSTVFTGNPRDMASPSGALWQYIELEYDGTNLIFRSSLTGVAGSFAEIGRTTVAAWVGALSWLGIHFNDGTAGDFAVFDWFRRMA